MKNVFLFSFAILSLSIFPSCNHLGNNKREEASSNQNGVAKIISKKPLRFDDYLGVELTVEIDPVDSSSGTTEHLPMWVPIPIYEAMSEIDDTTEVYINYIYFDFRKINAFNSDKIHLAVSTFDLISPKD